MAHRPAGENRSALSDAGRIQELVRRLAETEAELYALTAGQIDAVVDPERGTPFLLRQAQEALRRDYGELEDRVRERTVDLSRANNALRGEMAEREQAQAALELYAGQLRIISQMDRAILAAHTQEEIAEIALGHLRRLLECGRGSVALFDSGETRVIAAQMDSESSAGIGWRGPLPSPTFLAKLRRGELHIVEDLSTLAAGHPSIPALLAEGIRSCLIAPLLARDELYGTLSVGRPEPGPWPSVHMEIVRDVAVQLAVGIQQAQLRDVLQHHADELEDQVARRTAELQASEARSRTIFEAAGVGIAIIDRHGCMVESNPMLQEILGYSGEDLQGMPYRHLMLPSDVRTKEPILRQLIEGKIDEEPFCCEIRYLRRNGQLRWGQATVSLVRGANGSPTFAIAMLQDITEQKETFEALLEAEKVAVTGRLTALLAHEINNPLQSVVGCLGLAEKTLAESKDPSAYVGVARREVRRVADIVAQLGDMNRNSNDEQHTPVAVNKLVANALARVAGQCDSRNIQVLWDPAQGLPLIPLAADRMQQVFTNLALNAVEAMPTGGQLRVRSLYIGNPAGVQVSISDTGAGPGTRFISQLSEPVVADKPLGRGLGLYISNRIVEEHGGRIEVDSQTSKGTTFHVWLPARDTT
jgi:PAS domain S-box-containing protein